MSRMILLGTLLLLTWTPAFAKPLILPAVGVEVVDGESGHPVASANVTLLAKDKRRDDYRVLESAPTDPAGRAQFAPTSVDDLGYFAVRVEWTEEDRPKRGLVYQFKAKKGKKRAGGRAAEPGRTRSYYDLNGTLEGDCKNLFSVRQASGSVTLTFRKPSGYAECQKAHFKHADVSGIGERNINARGRNLYSFDRDIQMGRQFSDSMGPQQPILDDPVVNRYVVGLIDRLGQASDMPDLDYHVQVIDADVLNAFALPGGYVFVYRGLIEATETESELVGVLAHEIAHVTGRHGTEGVTSGMAKMATAMVLGGVVAEGITDNRAAQELIVGSVMAGTNLWVMGGTRKRESEADRLGSQYALRAGYDPRGLATFFDKLSAQREHKGSRLDKYFSDHPPDDVRVANVGEMVDYFLPPRDDLIVSSLDYLAIKKRLADMPPPRLAGEPAANALFSSFKAANEELMWTEFLSYMATEEAEGGNDEEDGDS